jgi:hypothetical protein
MVARHPRFLLGDADEQHSLLALLFAQILLHHLVLAHPFLEAHQVDLLALEQLQDLTHKTLALARRRLGRGEAVSEEAAEIPRHSVSRS